jgi:hypothetical protein
MYNVYVNYVSFDLLVVSASLNFFIINMVLLHVRIFTEIYMYALNVPAVMNT